MNECKDQLFSDSRDDQILRAGYEVFRTHGFRAARLEDVARTVGLSRPGIYQYFKGKKELFRALGERMHRCAEARVQAVIRDSGDCRSCIHEMFRARDVWLITLLFQSAHGREFVETFEELTGDITLRYRQRFRGDLLRVVRAGVRMEELEIAPTDLSLEDWTDTLIRAVRGAELNLENPVELDRRISLIMRVFLA